MFYGEDVFKEISVLSGGEKVRLKLCEIMKKGPNLLILDEPTNHLDIVGKETLENLLENYLGTIIFVSHDRYFVNKIANKLLIFEKNKVTFWDGDYDSYLENRNLEENIIIDNVKQDIKPKKVVINPLKEKTKLENQLNKIELEISKIEDNIDKLKNELLKEEVYSDYIKVQEIEENINAYNSELEEKMNLWDTLLKELENYKKI